MLKYFERGEGERPALLLHGLLGSGRNLATLARRWADADASRRLVLPDLAGHGGSPPLPAEPGLRHLADAVVVLLARLRTGVRVPIVGHSLGGRAALYAARLRPDLVGDLVLLDIGPGPLPAADIPPALLRLVQAPDHPESKGAARRWLEDGDVTVPLVEWLLMNLVRQEDGRLGWRVDRRRLTELYRAQGEVDLWDVVESGGRRVVAVRGGRSDQVGPEEEERLRAAGAEVHTLPDAGHFLHVDALDALVELLLEVDPGPGT